MWHAVGHEIMSPLQSLLVLHGHADDPSYRYINRMQQAVRVSDKTVFFLLGEVIESGDTEKLFSVPQDKRTEDYITGRFG